MAQSPPHALLLIEEGATQRTVDLLLTPFTIGRLPDRDLVLSSAYVSRTHAQLVLEDGDYFLVDQASQSGTYVNGWRVQRQKLNQGDQIQIGSLDGPKLHFQLREQAGSTSLRDLLQQIPDTSGSESDLAKLRWFVDAARRLNDRGAVAEILTVLIESTLQLTRAERGYVFLCNSANQLELAVGKDARGEPLSDDATVSHTAIDQAIHSGSEFIVTDTLSAEADAPSYSIVAHSLRSIVCIPLRRRGTPTPSPQAKPPQDATEVEDAPATPDHGSVLGVLYLDSREHRGKLTTVDSNLLNVVATEAALLVQNAALVQAEEAARRYGAELRIAFEIQQDLMKVRLPRLDYAEVQAQSLPCKEVGGDFFDAVATGTALYLVVADVSGKGISAALLGSTLQGLLHAQMLADQGLVQIASLANQFLCGKNIAKYATMVLLRLTPTGQLEYLNCGHIQPLVHAPGRQRLLGNSNLPVGLIAGSVYTSETFCLQPGERILVMTDGLTEAEDSAGSCFGDACLARAIADGDSLNALLAKVRAFTAGAPLEDDCTVLELCYAACVLEPLPPSL